MTYHGEEQEIIDFAESPAFDDYYGDDYDPYSYDDYPIYDDDGESEDEFDDTDETPLIEYVPVANPERSQL